MSDELDNPFAINRVGSHSLVIGKPPAHAITQRQAYVLAAWLVAEARGLAGVENFADILREIAHTRGETK